MRAEREEGGLEPPIPVRALRVHPLTGVPRARAVRAVRDEAKHGLEYPTACGLLTDEERERLLAIVTVADGPSGDGKKDKYPTKMRPCFAFQKASLLNHALFKAKHYSCPHTFWGIETDISRMAATFEEAEHIATSVLPMPYAQLTRLLMLIFVAILPVAYVQKLGVLMLPLAFTASAVYFLVDECSGQMETPFGTELNDVEIEKTIRRIDKLSAAQLSQWLDGKPITNYNLFPEARSTDKAGEQTRKLALMGAGTTKRNLCQGMEMHVPQMHMPALGGMHVAQIHRSTSSPPAAASAATSERSSPSHSVANVSLVPSSRLWRRGGSNGARAQCPSSQASSDGASPSAADATAGASGDVPAPGVAPAVDDPQ